MQESIGDVQIGEVLTAFSMLVRRHFPVLAIATIGLGAVDLGLALSLGDQKGGDAIGNVLSIAVLYFVLRHLLRNEGFVVDEGRFGSYFGVHVLSGLGLVIGLLLLVLPGLYLFVRWSLASPLTIARGERATEALASSWHATRTCVWRLFGLYAVAVLGALTGLVVAGAAAYLLDSTLSSPVALGLILFAADFMAVASAFLTTAIYGTVIQQSDQLNDVFA